MKYDWGKVQDETKDAIKAILGEFVEATSEDLERYADKITGQLVLAQAQGRDDLVESLIGQMEMLGELTRVRANAAQWKAVQTITGKVIGTVVKVLTTAVL